MAASAFLWMHVEKLVTFFLFASCDMSSSSTPSSAPPQRGTRRSRGRGRPSRATKNKEHSHDQEHTPSHHHASDRKSSRKFGAKLTHQKEASAPAPPPTVREYTDLRSRIVTEISQGEYDCIICYNAIKRKHPIWSCTRCYAVLHLSCVRTWAERSVTQIKEQNALHQEASIRDMPGHWRCPGCQDVKHDVPRTYKCWCHRVSNPHPPSHGVPHSCGGRCKRGCKRHGCPANKCHPGPCPPCAATVEVACFCGKEPHMHVRCSQLPPETGGRLSCGNACGKSLACGHHTCAQPCHAGPCAPCAEILVDVPCFCGRHARTITCGERPPEAAGLRACWSCQEPCGAPLACGHHTCQKPCHIRTGVAPCPYGPDQVRTCPCGRTPLLDRLDCRDPIPTCEASCGKIHASCGHACSATCHIGPCPPCEASVLQVCRCGASKRRVMCCEAKVSNEPFLCDQICKVSRHCGKHVCQQRCCPLAYQASVPKKMLPTDLSLLDPMHYHACHVRCQKPLSCGRHTCDAPCHRGACAPCLRSTFTEVSCTCGRTVLDPPVPCGTQVECSYPCSLPPPPCGHPKISHTCHPPDTPCPPCVHLTNKVCMCGRTTLPAVPCSRKNVRCSAPCRRTLACGQHTCSGACHAEGECPPCKQVCGRPRPLCGHPCERPCHAPVACDTSEPCRAMILRHCECGHREQLDVCGAAPGVDREPVPMLSCTPACKVAQRNARFARALGLDVRSEHVSYAPALVQYVAQDPRGAQAVQDVLNEFVQSPRAAAQVHSLLASYALRRGCEPIKVHMDLLTFVEQLARMYHLETELCTLSGLLYTGPLVSPARDADVRVRRTRDTRIPSVLLTEYAATQPARSALEARRHVSPRTPYGNAVWIDGVLDDAALSVALQRVNLNGQRSWHVRQVQTATLLTHIRLEPQSLASVASGPKPQGNESLSTPTERRLLRLCEDVQHAWESAGAKAPATVALCACADDVRITHLFRQGRWERYEASLA